jgi:ATP-dependent helicase/nuclease subunit A
MSDSLSLVAAQQRKATDPTASAWVSANAGTGKTYVLVRRVLRILLAGSAPDRILCLTFTKAAASEMANRLFRQLAAWATADEVHLGRELTELLGRPPSQAETARTRTLFASAIETPGGLKVQTIHGFCERLLQRFPLEAGLSPGFIVLDEQQQTALLKASTEAVLNEATTAEGPLQTALHTVIAHAGEMTFDSLLKHAINERETIHELLQKVADFDDPFSEIEQRLRRLLKVSPDATTESIAASFANLLEDDAITHIVGALYTGTVSDHHKGDRLSEALLATRPADRIAALTSFLLTKENEPRKRLATKGVGDEHPGLINQLTRAAEDAAGLTQQRLGVELAVASAALLRIADRVIAGYTKRKAEAAGLDYADLIAKTAGLLSSSADTQWVLFKLDGGLDHILVDEAQDTSPLQWRIVTALAEEFFVSTGNGDRLRTVFAVGDEKQSIYGFQGAAPEEFDKTGRKFEGDAQQARTPYFRVALNTSFRSVAPVLEAVDRVFATPEAAAGLTASGDAVRHAAHRLGHAGRIEIWPTEMAEEVEPEEPWLPLAPAETTAPEARLAARIADTVAGWVAKGELLPSENRPITPGDVLILLRKRQPFAPVMIRALKERGLPVAGADRIKVTQQIGVEDLVTLGKFLLLPEDDLALATVLKSPLIGLDDDDLFKLGHGRRGTLWSTLQKLATDDARFTEAVEALKRWRSEADFFPPFEFYSRLLDKDGRRGRLLTRLGPEAGDAIDEFLNLAIRFDMDEPPSLQGFLDWLGRAEPEIKRDMDQGRNEVRVMTVHGAKGLEAPIVFLPDTCSVKGAGDSNLMTVVKGEPPVWALKGASSIGAIAGARIAKADADRHERNRLLYVAMTRARDRLYIGGFQRKTRPEGCWYDLIGNALGTSCQKIRQPDGRDILRLDAPQTAAPKSMKAEHGPMLAPQPYPDWALTHAPKGTARMVPLVPSRIAPLETEEGSGMPHPKDPAPGPRIAGTGNRFLRGSLTHALLQHLPTVAERSRAAAAKRYLTARAAEFPAKVRTSIVDEVLLILDDPQFGAVFGAGSEAEVPIAAEIVLASGPPLRIAGQIDRLLVSGDTVTVIDFKTNRPPPRDVAAIPEAYLLQLAAYRLALARIYPGKTIEAALLWTYEARLMAVPAAMLDAHEKAILTGKPWA